VFELLRNGVKTNGQLNRSDPERGVYKNIPTRDYAVLDFYQVASVDFNGD
jgi:hypothetical protein